MGRIKSGPIEVGREVKKKEKNEWIRENPLG